MSESYSGCPPSEGREPGESVPEKNRENTGFGTGFNIDPLPALGVTANQTMAVINDLALRIQAATGVNIIDHQALVQEAADARAAVRTDIECIIQTLKFAERAGPAGSDIPEGIRCITVSDTLGKQWIESLETARRLL